MARELRVRVRVNPAVDVVIWCSTLMSPARMIYCIIYHISLSVDGVRLIYIISPFSVTSNSDRHYLPVHGSSFGEPVRAS